MTVRQLKAVLNELPPDFPVRVILNGMIDNEPTWNVDDDCIYIEGVHEPCNS